MDDEPEVMTRAAYDVVADSYADHFSSTEPEQPLDLAMIDHFARGLGEPKRVLDAGCGAGRMLPVLAGLGCDPEGIDLSPAMVRRAHQDHPEFVVRTDSVAALPHQDDTFDGVFAWYSIIHSPDPELEPILAEFARVLRPGGLLLLSFQVGSDVRRVGQGYATWGHQVVLHRHHRTTELMAERLGRHGLVPFATMQREPLGAEADPQAVVIVKRPALID